MDHCPKCSAEVLAEAQVCQKCGYKSLAMPTRTVKPAMKHKPAGLHFANHPSQFAQPAQESRPGAAAEEKPVSAPGRPGNWSNRPVTPAGLIRPIGTTPTQHPTKLAAALVPRATPAHLLALTPLTPSVPRLPPSQQFLRPTFLPSKHQKPRAQDLSEQRTVQFEANFESYVATSKAAEHWRTSWRNRRRSAAAAVTSIRRGQSLVTEPLPARQDSLIRLRAIIAPRQKPNKPGETGKRGKSLGFWITIFLMLSLVVGLAVFKASTYLSHAGATALVNARVPLLRPRLSIQGPQATTIRQGQVLHLHGEHFEASAPIIFLLDAGTIINDRQGLEISLLTSAQGTFDVAMPTSTWSVGKHLLAAQDNRSGQSAYLNIQVSRRTKQHA